MKKYVFCTLPISLGCFGGGGGRPAAPTPAPPPPQLAKTPQAAAVRAETANLNVAQGGGQQQGTLLTGGMGDTKGLDKLGKKTLIGG